MPSSSSSTSTSSLVASALTEKAFADRRRPEWEELDVLTLDANSGGIKKLDAERVVRFSPLYRTVCADLAAAQAASYSAPLIEYLRGLTAAAHSVMYGPHAGEQRNDDPTAPADTSEQRKGKVKVKHTWLVAFPRAVRRRKRAMLLATALFFIPFAIGMLLTLRDPSFAFRVVPEGMLRPLTEAYAKGFDGDRESGNGALMVGFYVYNNVGIALRCFALGVFGGIGSAFYLVQNGLTIGAVLGYVTSQGAGANIVLFIVGHGTLELGAIVLAGGSGLSLGWSIVAPGDLPRLVSLQRRAREILVIVGGASVMLFMAAAIEAFWSGSSVPREVKVAVGSTLFVLVMLYICLAGRGGGGKEKEASSG